MDSRTIGTVSDSELHPYGYLFSPMPDEQAKMLFALYHAINERLYLGDGIWVGASLDPFHPTVRQTSRRIIGYLGAYKATGEDIYKYRAREGLAYLLSEQKDSGEYPWYRNSVVGVFNCNDGLYEAGIAGVAMLDGYAIMADPVYLTSAEKTARWELACPVSLNFNYNLFSVWHLSRQYQSTGNMAYLNGALSKVMSTIEAQLPNGRWEGHNSWIWYHSIILRGLAELYAVMPADHEMADKLMTCIIKAVNRMIVDQQSDGSIPPNPDDSEYDLRKPVRNTHRNALALHALCTVRMHMKLDVDNLVEGILKYRLNTEDDHINTGAIAGALEVPGNWQSRRENSGCQAPSYDYLLTLPDEKKVFEISFDEFADFGEFGYLPYKWFLCWLPGRMPRPGQATFSVGKAGTEVVCSIWQSGLYGIGLNLADLGVALINNHRYRLSFSVAVGGPCYNPEQVLSIILSTYSGSVRPEWDMISQCTYAVCKPQDQAPFDIVHWFTANGPMNSIYLSIDVGSVSSESFVNMIINSVVLTDEGISPENAIVVPCYDDYDCSTMAMGVYLSDINSRQVK